MTSHRRLELLIIDDSDDDAREVAQAMDRGSGAGHLRLDRTLLFRPFERLDSRQSGAGLGLVTVHRPAERMGGRAGGDSEVGAGSRFWMDLPTPEAES